MKLVILRSTRRVSPFNEPLGQSVVGLGTLDEWHAELARHAGAELVHVDVLEEADTAGEAAWVMDQHVFVTLRLLRTWLPRARAAGGPVRLSLPRSRFVELYGQHMDLAALPDGGAAYDSWFLPGGLKRGTTRTSLEQAPPLAPPFKEKLLTFPVPRNILGRPEHVHPLTTTVAMHLKHWMHLLWLGNLWPQIEMVERITRAPLATALRLVSSVRPTWSSSKWAAARAFTWAGRDVDVHPTACVEFSVLGDGCRVGPFALVRGSVLGRGVHVEERANVCYSLLGHGDFVSKNSTVVSCVGYPDADLCINGMQYCLAGRNSALTSLVRPMDMKYRADVTVRVDGRSVAVRELMLGSCFGHRTFVGPDVLIAPGREIPNDTVVAPSAGGVLTRVDPGLYESGGVARVINGVLTRVEGGTADA